MRLKELTPRLLQLLGQWNFTKANQEFTSAQMKEVANFLQSVINIFREERNVDEAIELLKQGNQVPIGIPVALFQNDEASKLYFQLLRTLQENGATTKQLTELLDTGPESQNGEKKTVGMVLAEYDQSKIIEFFALINNMLDKDPASAEAIFKLINPGKVMTLGVLLIWKNSKDLPLDAFFKLLERFHSLKVPPSEIRKVVNIDPYFALGLVRYFKTHPAMLLSVLRKEILSDGLLEKLKDLKKSIHAHVLTLSEQERNAVTLEVKTKDSSLYKYLMVKRHGIWGFGGRKPNPESRTRGEFGKFNVMYDAYMAQERKVEYEIALAKDATALDLAIKMSLEDSTNISPQVPAAARVDIDKINAESIKVATFLNMLMELRKKEEEKAAQVPPPSYQEAVAMPSAFSMVDTLVPPPFNPNACYPFRVAPGEYLPAPLQVMEERRGVQQYQTPTENFIEHSPVTEQPIPIPAAVAPVTTVTPAAATPLYGTEVDKEIESKLLDWKVQGVIGAPGTMFSRAPAQQEKDPEKREGVALTG